MNIDYRPGSFTVVDSSGREAAFDGDQYKWEITDGMLIVNAITTDQWSEDLAALSEAEGLRGIVLAETEQPDHITRTAMMSRAGTPVIGLIESAVGLVNAVDIAKAPGTFRLAFGSGDYRRDTGTSADDLAMSYPRSRLVVASRIGGLPGPIDGPTVSSSHPVLREQTAVTVSLGLTGKLCLDMDQLPVINEVISPTPSDVAWARDFLADFDARFPQGVPSLRECTSLQVTGDVTFGADVRAVGDVEVVATEPATLPEGARLEGRVELPR